MILLDGREVWLQDHHQWPVGPGGARSQPAHPAAVFLGEGKAGRCRAPAVPARRKPHGRGGDRRAEETRGVGDVKRVGRSLPLLSCRWVLRGCSCSSCSSCSCGRTGCRSLCARRRFRVFPFARPILVLWFHLDIVRFAVHHGDDLGFITFRRAKSLRGADQHPSGHRDGCAISKLHGKSSLRASNSHGARVLCADGISNLNQPDATPNQVSSRLDCRCVLQYAVILLLVCGLARLFASNPILHSPKRIAA